MLGHAHASSPVTESGKPLSAHGSTSPEVMRPSLAGIKSRASQLQQYQSPTEMNPNSYSPATNPSSGTYSGTASSNGTDNYQQSNNFKRSNSDSIPQRQGSASTTPMTRPQRHASFGMSDGKPAEFSRPPLQTNVGPYGLLSGASGNQSYHGTHNSPQTFVAQQNFTPFSLPPPGFNTATTSAAASREPEPTYPTSMPTEYQGDSMPQNSGPDLMLLDQMTAPNTMPVFGGEGYSRSPFAIPEDFVAYLFSEQQLTNNSSPMGQMGPQGYAKSVPVSAVLNDVDEACSYPENTNQYYAPFYAGDMGLGGFFPASQQPHHPMAVTSLLDTSQPEMVLSEEKSQAIVDLIKDRFNEGDHAPVARQKEALMEGDRTVDSHLLSRKMMQTYIGSYWYNFSEQVPICE